ncbi:hypothetical protein [Klebsiella aerogenes]|uniref:hypothetical protein n=1 Tax=Klebsiella aerogenes TaxID=548 RepID=UPI0037530D6E
MERTERKDRAAFLIGGIGRVIDSLIASEIAISKDAIADNLEAKCRALGNVIHKGVVE